MKKLLFIFLVTLLYTNSFAQDRRHEIKAGIGILSTNTIAAFSTDILSSGLSAGTYSANSKYKGTLFAEYKYAVSERFSIGAVFTFDRGTSDAFFRNDKVGTYDRKWYTIAPEISFTYVNSEMFKMYASLGAGVSFYNQVYESLAGNTQKDGSTGFAFQVTPIGIKFGKQFGLFAEAGLGYKGIISAGLYLDL